MEKTPETELDTVRRWIVDELDDAKAVDILELDIRPLTQMHWMASAAHPRAMYWRSPSEVGRRQASSPQE